MAKKTVHDYLPFIRSKPIYFAVSNALNRIESGCDMEESIRICAEQEEVSYDTIKNFVKHAYADMWRDRTRRKSKAGETDKPGYKYYLIGWSLPGADADAMQWKIQRAKCAKNARESTKRKLGAAALIWTVVEYESSAEANRALVQKLEKNMRKTKGPERRTDAEEKHNMAVGSAFPSDGLRSQ